MYLGRLNYCKLFALVEVLYEQFPVGPGVRSRYVRSRSRLFSLSRLLDQSASHANTVHTGPVLACGCDLDGRASRTHKLLGVEEGDAAVPFLLLTAAGRQVLNDSW